MLTYIFRRLLLIPITIFFIILVNFVIINLAPGDPTTLSEITPDGSATRQADAGGTVTDERYLQFREFFGLTKPILWNRWPSITEESVRLKIAFLADEKNKQKGVKVYNEKKLLMGDQAQYVMHHLLNILEDAQVSREEKVLAAHFFIRGGRRFPKLGAELTREERDTNAAIAEEIFLLEENRIHKKEQAIEEKVSYFANWYLKNKEMRSFEPSGKEATRIFFTETRFYRYFSRVVTLDFGVMRSDESKSVIKEVVKRFKYSLTLAIVPMFFTFFLCQFFGFLMALKQKTSLDYSLNLVFLVLYALPVFVVGPFLIEKVAVNNTFFFTDIPIPYSGFQSVDTVYDTLTSKERLFDIVTHLFLPLIGVMYSGLATQSRLSRTAVLEVLRQDYVRTAYAKGLSTFSVIVKHVGRNSAITIVTSLAGSLGVVLGGSLIIETLFEIDGFGRFFYSAIIDRDYNVIMFSALASSVLTLTGYLLADIAYTILDPRVTLD